MATYRPVLVQYNGDKKKTQTFYGLYMRDIEVYDAVVLGRYVYITSNAGRIFRYVITSENLKLVENLVPVVEECIGIGAVYPKHSGRLYIIRTASGYYAVDEFSESFEYIQRIALYSPLSGQVPVSVVGIHNRVYVARSDRAIVDVWDRDGNKVDEIAVGNKRKGLDYDGRNFFDYHTTSVGMFFDQRLGFSDFDGKERKYFSFGGAIMIGFIPKSVAFDGGRYDWLYKQQSSVGVEPKEPEYTYAEQEEEYAANEI